MGFENNYRSKLEQENPGKHPVVVEMHKVAQKILDADAIDPHDFIDLYGAERVNKDLEYVTKLKEKFEVDDSKKAAEVLEAIFFQHSELSDWLGPNAETIRPSEYDDIVNGVDIIAEFNTEDTTKHLALGVDVSFGTLSVGKKFDRIKREIDADNLAEVKYFESHGFKGSLRQLPRIVIGVEKNTIIELASLWQRNKNKELGSHSAKHIIISEIIDQLKIFLDYATKHEKLNAIKSYTQALKSISELQHTIVRQTREQKEAVISDKMYQSIKEQLTQKFSI